MNAPSKTLSSMPTRSDARHATELKRSGTTTRNALEIARGPHLKHSPIEFTVVKGEESVTMTIAGIHRNLEWFSGFTLDMLDGATIRLGGQ
jgi:hypothetical protein